MTESTPYDVRKLRAELLANFARYAEHVLTAKSGLQSMMLLCSQFYADEAGDAVHDNIRVSKRLVPIEEARARADYNARSKLMRWDSNGEAIFAFSAHCSEEGATPYALPPRETEDPEEEFWEGGSPTESPLALAQRLDGRVQVSWLGFPHRPWLDFAEGFGNRDEYFAETPAQFVPDPPPATLLGDEARLHAQVLDEPDDLGPRQVLCDLWAQRGDPRGEFGALCFSGKRTPKVLAQVASLVLEHGRSWMGPLTKVIPCSGALFGDGPFLEKVIAHFDTKTFKALGNDAHWATVKSLTLVGEGGGVTPAMQSLLEVGPLRRSQLAPLKKGDWKIRALEFVAERAQDLKDLAAVKLPLQRLSLRAGGDIELKPLKKAAWFEQLTELELWLPGFTVDVGNGLATGLVSLEELAPSRTVLRVGVTSPGGRTGWVLQRDARGQRSLRLMKPDERLESGVALAKTLGVELDDRWTPADDWLHFGLGVVAEAG